ncbi:ATP phosphoribosyltransferase regulatory subunit [Clostridia bacterium]|nr:ATP phosphoribosyltransferase regulatory subunit [Clostridia bacterium]
MKNKWNIPPGMKDVLPGEARKRRRLINELMDNFTSYGYEEVGTSSLEYYDVVERDGMDSSEVFKLIDREGQILALRPDVTTPIARMVASRLRDRRLPFRLSYTGSTFRYEAVQVGRQREFTQVGVELIGSDDLMADLEILLLAMESVEKTGIKEFKIGIGEINITQGFLREMLPDEDLVVEARVLVIQKNFVGLEALLKKHADPQKARVFMQLVRKNGGEEILDEIKGYSDGIEYQAAIAGLKELAKVVREYGYGDKFFFDFSILRSFSYYTGIVFEGYAEGIGHPICGGGRYDGLLGMFGFEAPAVGFAMGVERVMIAREEVEEKDKKDVLILGDDYAQIVKKARELRDEGMRVEIDLTSADLAEAAAYMEEKGIERLFVMENDDDGE